MHSKIVKPKMTFGKQLRFTPFAWAKMLYMRDRGDTEVAGYGVTETEDPLLVTDFRLIKSECEAASFKMNPDDAVEFMETMMDEGLMPWQYSNILIHTHPGNGPNPSPADEKNFIAAFSHPNWAIMFIIAEGGDSYCRMKVNIGPGVVKEIPVAIDWKYPFCGTNKQKWEEEYKAKVVKFKFRMTGKEGAVSRGTDCFPSNDPNGIDDPLWYDDKEDRWIDFSQSQADESKRLSEDCESRDCSIEEIECFWDANGDVSYWDDEEEIFFYYDPTAETWYKDLNDDNEVVETTPPNKPWVTQIVSWAYKYAEERHLVLD